MSHKAGRLAGNGWWLAVSVVLAIVGAALVSARVMSTSDDPTVTPGVSANAIVLGSHQPLTGPAAPGYAEISAAIKAFFTYVNAHGGVYGRDILFDYADDGYNPVRTLAVTQRLVRDTHVFAMDAGLGTAPHQAVVSYLNTNQVPDLFVETGCTCFNNPVGFPETFGFFPNYMIEGKLLAQYVRGTYPVAPVAYLLQDDDLGQGGQDGLNQIINSTQVVTRQSYDADNLTTGLVSQVAAAKAAGAKVVVLFGIPAATALALLAAAQLHYHPKWVVSSVGADPLAVDRLLRQYSQGKLTGAVENGLVTDDYLPAPGDSANPWIALFRTVHDLEEPDQPFDFDTVNGMALAYLTYQALHAAGPNLTRAGLLAALTSKGATFHGPNLAPFGFSAASHDGMLGARLATVASGQLQLTGPIWVTDDQDGPVTTYTGPHPPPPSTF